MLPRPGGDCVCDNRDEDENKSYRATKEQWRMLIKMPIIMLMMEMKACLSSKQWSMLRRLVAVRGGQGGALGDKQMLSS